MGDIKNKKEDSLKYTGEIKVTIKKGKKTISSNKYKNSGRWPLFYFLNECLKGDYQIAENWKPRYVNLFEAGQVGAPLPEIKDNGTNLNEIQSYTNTKVSLITHPWAEDPDVEKNESDGIGSSNIIYNFVIPFTHIDTSKKVNLICLYCRNEFKNYGNPSMFFFVNGGEGHEDSLGDILSDLRSNGNDISSKDNEYNLFIEWTLNISNNKKEK